ncbi:type III secretion system needle filament subunit SctF [Parendozoicomonas haliclonae]|uniref:Yop protein translocation protein F n=1 Tax=Parendozoicomonas haliclonae TaxID=1960125 RepID=A0A1X7AEP7_9GAMM|nr:type III secretion system needle filament subunit SctF [Parendozoicomonas haliclonae]SMA33843.1 Yop protein translocation protein F [Parendozoicomonas haliclonae]
MSDNLSSTPNLSFDSTTQRLNEKLNDFESTVKTRMDSLDPSNMADLIAFQQEMNKLTMMYSLESGVIKSIKDTAQGIIQKIN